MMKVYKRSLLRAGFLKRVIIVCAYSELDSAIECINSDFDLIIEKICLSDYATYPIREYKHFLIDDIKNNLTADNVAVFINNPHVCEFPVEMACSQLRNNANIIYFFFKDMDNFPNGSMCTFPIVGFLDNLELKKAYSLLSDRESQEKYLAKCMSIETGLVDYLKYDDEIEYFPKKLMPIIKEGDCVLNGGISSGYCIDVLRMSEIVGREGRVFCFEPNKKGFDGACKYINDVKGVDNIIMQPLGLWNESCRLKITDEGGSSTAVYVSRAPADLADFVTIDDFVAKNRISHVDFIKLDIEGSELKALEGGRKTIKEMAPSMAISVYHQPDHMYEIMLYLARTNSGYNFYIYHHSAGLWETCMYAVLEKNIFIRLWKRISFYFKNKVWRSKRLSKIFLKKNVCAKYKNKIEMSPGRIR